MVKAKADQVILENCGQNICRCTGYVLYLRAIHKVVLNTPGLTQ
jgi:aerobic-type carbon monoxide dehydrogenase small subunit (CoxS/CutS family)